MTNVDLDRAAQVLLRAGEISAYTIRGEEIVVTGSLQVLTAEALAARLADALENYSPPLPASVSNLAFTESLIEHNIFPDAVEALIDLIADDKHRWLAKVRWQQSRIALSDPVLQAQAAAFGLTAAQLDAIYARAVEIEQG